MSKIDLEAFKGFTPGPWRLEKETTLIWGACNPHIEGSYGMGYPVALAERKRSWSRTSEPTDCEIEANAILIAAAPDLLALAKEQSEEIKRLRAAMDIAKDFIDNQSDVVDGDYGEPAPNAAMQCLNEIAFAMGEKP